MGALLVRCPRTRHPISTGIEIDTGSLAKMASSRISVACPHCVGSHEFKIGDAYISTTIPDAHLQRLRKKPTSNRP
jgi:hypothetical protein